MVIRIDWDARYVMTRQDARPLLALLGAVVARLAKALQVLGIEEQSHVSLVRPDVVDSISSLYRA